MGGSAIRDRDDQLRGREVRIGRRRHRHGRLVGRRRAAGHEEQPRPDEPDHGRCSAVLARDLRAEDVAIPRDGPGEVRDDEEPGQVGCVGGEDGHRSTSASIIAGSRRQSPADDRSPASERAAAPYRTAVRPRIPTPLAAGCPVGDQAKGSIPAAVIAAAAAAASGRDPGDRGGRDPDRVPAAGQRRGHDEVDDAREHEPGHGGRKRGGLGGSPGGQAVHRPHDVAGEGDAEEDHADGADDRRTEQAAERRLADEVGGFGGSDRKGCHGHRFVGHEVAVPPAAGGNATRRMTTRPWPREPGGRPVLDRRSPPRSPRSEPADRGTLGGVPNSPRAGHPAEPSELVDVAALLRAYHDVTPDPSDPSQRVAFGTSGHRGSAFRGAFNEAHILAITEAICRYRAARGYDGPLFLGRDTHALSEPATATALEVLAAHGVDVRVASDPLGVTPTPAVSHAILVANRGRAIPAADAPATAGRGLADGIVVTPSHNPPDDGGFKYNPPNGGPADTDVTGWVQAEANRLLEGSGSEGVAGIRSASAAEVRAAAHPHDFLGGYVGDLPSVVDLEAIRASGLRIGVDPMGGASVAYWAAIAERHGLDLTVVNDAGRPDVRVHDHRLGREDPHGPLVPVGDGRADRAPRPLRRRPRQRRRCRSARGRHAGRRSPEPEPLPERRDRLPVRRRALLAGRDRGRQDAGVVVDDRSRRRRPRAAARRGPRRLQVVRRRVSSTARSASAARRAPARRSSAATGRSGRPTRTGSSRISSPASSPPGPAATRASRTQELTERFGTPAYRRVDAPATPAQKAALAKLSPADVTASTLAATRSPRSSPARRATTRRSAG